MKIFKHDVVVECDIDSVWDFFTDSNHFEKISPNNLNERLLRTTNQKLSLGVEVWISTSLFVTRNWHSKIIRFEPYEYSDRMQGGLFTTWTHTHKFISINNRQTKISDEIAFQMPFGIVGKMVEMILLWKLRAVFECRAIKTKQILET